MDVTTRDKEVAERLDKEREITKEKLSMSRTTSRTASERSPLNSTKTPPPSVSTLQTSASPKIAGKAPLLAPTVRPTLSFANAAKKESAGPDEKIGKTDEKEVNEVAEKVTEVNI